MRHDNANIPQALLSERAFLGSVLAGDFDLIDKHAEVQPGTFYDPLYQRLYAIAVHLRRRDVAPTPELIVEELRKAQQLEQYGGEIGLAEAFYELSQHITAGTALEEHAANIVRTAQLRNLITLGTRVVKEAYAAEADPDSLYSRLASAVRKLSERGKSSVVSLHSVVSDAFDGTAARAPVFYDTPWDRINEIWDGKRPGTLITIGGRPSMGKSAWLLQDAMYTAEKHGPVLFWSLEVPPSDLAARLIGQSSELPTRTVLRRSMDTQVEWQQYNEACARVAQIPLFFGSDSNLSTVLAETYRLVSQEGIVGLVIDYLQLVVVDTEQYHNRVLELSYLTRTLKLLARELGIFVEVAAQVSRRVEDRKDHRPTTADLRESGSIEQDSDVVAFLYRDELYDPETDFEGLAEFNKEKDRDGPAPKGCTLAWDAPHTRFRTTVIDLGWEEDEEEAIPFVV